jgi:2-oxoglutarate ferredoxin oxidoreductase subunit beta
MTGGQMAPTTLPGQFTQTTPYGRDTVREGFPIRVSEMLATLDGATYIERTMVVDPKSIATTKKAIRKAFEVQKAKKGFSMVEILSNCPTNWGLTPLKSLDWLKENMVPYYPLGVYADKGGNA